jgi:pimeloyl-ACP methyl ester carboxylesterase
LIAEGVNLQAYTIDNNAADVAMVTKALGYDRYNLYGLSFGTLLAQTVMRDHPEGLRGVIMDSVLPVTLDASTHGDSSTLSVTSRLLALHQLFADCAADPTGARFYPDLEDTTYDTVTRLSTEPAVLTFEYPETGEPFEVTLSGDRLLGMISQALYGGMGSQIPILLDLVAAGEYDLVFSADMFLEGDGVSTWSAGLHQTMNCSALPELVAVDLNVQGLDALVVQFRNETFEEFNTVCGQWGIENPDHSAIPPAISDIPTLLLSGELDPNTPPRNAEIVAENLENSTAVVFPGQGHEVIHRHACPRSIALAFLEDPSAPPDTTCAGEMVSRFASEPITVRLLALQKNPPFLRLILLVGSLLLLLSGVVAWLIAMVRGRGRRGEQVNRITQARWATGAAAALNIAFVVILVASNPTQVVYGYPIALRLGMLLPLVSIIPAVVGLVSSLLAWRDGTWRVTNCVHYILVVLGILVFVWQLDYWHLLGWRL